MNKITNMKKRLIILILALFLFRLLYGLASEFWSSDEFQIYLIGLKSFTTKTWPFYGPDIVYTNSQIPGALQGLLVSLPFYIAKIPESPTIFLNILSFISLSFFANYITKRIKGIPVWIVWVLVMTTTWTMVFTTKVSNPSYAIVFSIPFFVCILDLLKIYKTPVINPKIAFFILGISTTLIMQLHMSWVLLIPYTGIVFLLRIKTNIKQQLVKLGLYMFGIIIGALTLIPTLLNPQITGGKLDSNIVLNLDNWSNLPAILLKFLSFASYELPYMLGANNEQRFSVIKEQIWMSPVAVFLLIMGFAQIALFIYSFFIKNLSDEFKKIKWLIFGSVLLLYVSFFFSIKGPSPHTFYILAPIPIFFSFYCYQWLIAKKSFVLKILKVMAICGIIFHIGLGIYQFQHKSLYKDRAKIVQALDKMDYTILGNRRTDNWGYGY